MTYQQTGSAKSERKRKKVYITVNSSLSSQTSSFSKITFLGP